MYMKIYIFSCQKKRKHKPVVLYTCLTSGIVS